MDIDFTINTTTFLILYGTTVATNLMVIIPAKLYYDDIAAMVVGVIMSPFTLLYNFGLALHRLTVKLQIETNLMFIRADETEAFGVKDLHLQDLLLSNVGHISEATDIPDLVNNFDFLKGVLTEWETLGIVTTGKGRKKNVYRLTKDGAEKLAAWRLEIDKSVMQLKVINKKLTED